MIAHEAHDLIVTEQTRFDLQGNPYKVNLYTFFVGKHGPFSFEYKCGEETQATVEARIMAKVNELRNLGVLPLTH
jgi:hypothetical protein